MSTCSDFLISLKASLHKHYAKYKQSFYLFTLYIYILRSFRYPIKTHIISLQIDTIYQVLQAYNFIATRSTNLKREKKKI